MLQELENSCRGFFQPDFFVFVSACLSDHVFLCEKHTGKKYGTDRVQPVLLCLG